MSRPIKFRAWDVFEKEMDYEVTIDPDGKVAAFNPLDGQYVRGFSEDEKVLMQYTGLKDRNGKEAYHKDIVDYEGFLYVIEWDEKNTGFYLAYIRDLDDPESEEHLKGSCITLSTIKSHALETGKLLQGEDTP